MKNTAIELITKTAVITGASSGVGLATAHLFAQNGYQLVLAARGVEGLEKAVSECNAFGGKAVYKSTDVSNTNEVKDLVEFALKEFGRIDVWVNNAGVMASGKFEEIPMDINEQVIKTNLMGYMHGAYYVLPVFKEQNQGILINNVSIGGYMPAPFSSVYSATKTGIKGLMSGLQSEYSVYPEIHICNVYPQVQQSTGNMHSAKFSGLDFKIPPFASDPKDTAKAIYNLIDKPKNDTFPDATSFMLKLAHGAFPETFTNLTTGVLRLMMKVKKGKADEGNVLEPSTDPHAIYGQMAIPIPSKRNQKIIGTSLVLAVGFFVAKHLKNKSKKLN
ncbi:SDR family NAD(P)-dependent oxidoreductase [Empedobacter brevis]|uniref:SDR family NAD(P)-dependent oxidoreductase n=1 Tax=Empedobacter brevis TaxID=247 RepID=UPI0023F25267|nr:SDR family NAD(P)-dependent oxidoreductase [Empedobacter brevis]